MYEHRTVVGDDYRQRLEAAADEVETTSQQHRVAVERRNTLVAEAVDRAGLAQSVVARLVRVSQPHVVRILGKVSAALDVEPAALA